MTPEQGVSEKYQGGINHTGIVRGGGPLFVRVYMLCHLHINAIIETKWAHVDYAHIFTMVTLRQIILISKYTTESIFLY